ncbi:hypothetical protein QF002_001503 [Paraburkholderia youngii]
MIPQAVISASLGEHIDIGSIVSYSLSNEGDGWRADIERRDHGGNRLDAGSLSATVQTSCVS